MFWDVIQEMPLSAWGLGFFWASLAVLAGLEALVPQWPAGSRDQRWPTNFTLGAVNMAVVPLIPVSSVVAAQWAETNRVGLLNVLDLPGLWWWLVVPAATVLVRSLLSYVMHIALHKVPLLWRIHRVHHFDVAIDISTGLRAHPAEFVLALVVAVAVVVAFGLHPGTLIAYETIDLMFALFSHANVRLPPRLEAALRPVFVTPRWHLLHHSSYQPQTDSNYGTVFSFWDRLFGTEGHTEDYRASDFEIGLREVRDRRASSLWWQLKSPLLQVESQPSATLSADGSQRKSAV
jgi:sterol desaturase/sphingolipid hydroxylase (fatty acid hydroxylase superfamily)